MSNPFDQFDNQPRGLRNNNPLNLTGSNWSGQTGSDGRFAQFETMEAGRAAADVNLQAYHRKHGLNTVSGVVGRWAPPNENDTGAYVTRVSRELGVGPNDPLDMADPGVRERMLDAMQGVETGVPVASGPNPFDQFDGAAPSLPRPAPKPSTPQSRAVPLPPGRPSTSLGFQKGVLKPLDNAAQGFEWLADRIGLDEPINALGAALGMPSNRQVAADRQAVLARARSQGVTPGKAGEFFGNIVGTAPLALLPGGAGVQGFLGGAALSDAKDAGGVLKDAAVGAVAGKVAEKGVKLVSNVASAALSKAPKVMSLPELEAAKRAAYAAVDKSGFRFKKADAQALASDVDALIRGKGGPKAAKLYADADAFAARLKALANQKGGLPLTQLDELRGDIYEALVKPGGKEAVVGKAIRQKIDALIASAADENALIRTARELNTRWAKANVVTKHLESADLAAKRAYTGKNVDNTIRGKMSPLVDPLSSKRLQNLTPDEKRALTRVVDGSGGQNVARTAGALLDPRGLLGMGLQGTLGVKTAGIGNLIGVPIGYLSTVAANRASQKNVEGLLRLIAAGGSKEALKRTPTAASKAVQKGATVARQGVGLIGAGAASHRRGER